MTDDRVQNLKQKLSRSPLCECGFYTGCVIIKHNETPVNVKRNEKHRNFLAW